MLASKMSDVSDCVSLSELKQVKYNVIYRDYKEVVNMAKYILKRYDYNMSEERGSYKCKHTTILD